MAPLVVTVVLAAGVAALFFIQREAGRRARLLKEAGFTLMALYTLLGGAFIIGETFDDPGGWLALGLVAAWAVPLGALGALAWYRPERAVPVFITLVAGVVGLSISFAVNPEGWRAIETGNGPVRDIVVFALAPGLAVLGLRNIVAAGLLLVVLGAAPLLGASIGEGSQVSLAVASTPPVAAGVLYVLSGLTMGRFTPMAGATKRGAGHPRTG